MNTLLGTAAVLNRLDACDYTVPVSDTELLIAIKDLTHLEKFFRTRGKHYGLITNALVHELASLQGYAQARDLPHDKIWVNVA